MSLLICCPGAASGGSPGRLAPPLGRASGLAAAVTAPALASYTAVLLAGTAVPAWHEAHPYLPFVFTGSALASGAGVGLLAAPTAQTGPAVRLALIGAAAELSATHLVETRLGLQSEAYHSGHPAKLLRTARALTVIGAAAAVLGRRSRLLSAAAGLALLSGSVFTRFGIYDGGVASAKDPRYTVVPQRARLDARQQAAAPPLLPRPLSGESGSEPLGAQLAQLGEDVGPDAVAVVDAEIGEAQAHLGVGALVAFGHTNHGCRDGQWHPDVEGDRHLVLGVRLDLLGDPATQTALAQVNAGDRRPARRPR